MAAGVVLDTSFLITLADSSRAHHQAARQYWRFFAEQGVPLFLPTIVVSEFCIKQALPTEIIRACVVLPFNWEDALKAASLDFTRFNRTDGSRDALKDDVKIIAQAMTRESAWIITDDTQSLFKYADELRQAGQASFCPIKLDDGFDLSLLNADGQRHLGFKEEVGTNGDES